MLTTALVSCLLALLPAAAPAQEAAPKARLLNSPGDVFRMDQYPAEARRIGEGGRVGMTLTVGTDGRVTKCTVVTSPLPNLDAETCRLATSELRFEAARDSVGEAVESTFPLAIVWKADTEEEPVESVVPMRAIEITKTVFSPTIVATEVLIDEEGRVASCRVSEGKVDGDACASFPLGREMGPGFLRNGKPVRAILRERRVLTTDFLP